LTDVMTGSLGNLVFCIGCAQLEAQEEPRQVYGLLQKAAGACASPRDGPIPIGVALLAYSLFLVAMGLPDQVLASDIVSLAGQALREQRFLDVLREIKGPQAVEELVSLLAACVPRSGTNSLG
jgi:hypothetical protein